MVTHDLGRGAVKEESRVSEGSSLMAPNPKVDSSPGGVAGSMKIPYPDAPVASELEENEPVDATTTLTNTAGNPAQVEVCYPGILRYVQRLTRLDTPIWGFG